MTNKGVGPKGYFEEYYMSRNWRAYRGLLSLVIGESEPGPILDLGSGCGYFVEACYLWGIGCSGLEGSERGVEISLGRCPGIDVKQHLLGEELPFENASYSAVVLNQVIEHLEPDVCEKCLQEAFRVLRPDGVLIVFSPCLYNKKEKLADPTHINLHTPASLSGLLIQTGFSSVRAIDEPFLLFGRSRIGRLLMKLIFRIAPWDRFSSTANCVAKKGNL